MKYGVGSVNSRGYGELSRFETYEEAEAEARRRAYEDGRDCFIFTATAIAKAPPAVNEVKVTAI